MGDENKPEEGLTEDELSEITGGAGIAVPSNIQVTRSITRLPNGTSQSFVKSLFGALPGGGTTKIITG
jgi:bacteriocin-like protein